MFQYQAPTTASSSKASHHSLYSDYPLQKAALTEFTGLLPLPLPQGMALLSKSDVFTPDGSTLLLTAGQKVDGTLLGRLICFGIKPEHFTFTCPAGQRLNERETQVLSKTLKAYWQRFDILVEGQHRAYQKPDEAHSTHPLYYALKAKTKKKTDILILDGNTESAAKTTHALKRNGVALQHVHSVTNMAMLKLSIESFEPHTVMVDFFQGKGQPHGAQLLCQLREDFPEVNLVLTLNWRSKILHPALSYWLKRLAHIKAAVLYKPLQVKALGAILNKRESLAEASVTLGSPQRPYSAMGVKAPRVRHFG
jgi:hypothetical protein